MRKLLLALVLLTLASFSSAQVVSSGGSFIAAGGTLSGCSIYSFVYVDVNGNLACNRNPVNGSLTSAGRATLTIADTITGASATSNFLSVTGTFPGTLSANANGVYVSIAADNDAYVETGVHSIITGTGPGSGATVGVQGDAGAASSAYNYGVLGRVSGNGTTGVGVIGLGYTGTNKIGGYFALANQNPPATSAALVIDNAAVAANIFEARDNGTAVLTVADGGGMTGTATWQSTTINATGNFNISTNTGGSGSGYWDTAGHFRINGNTSLTPDAGMIALGTTANSFHVVEQADAAASFDFNNGRCGTSACTSPALIIHSPDQVTTEYAQISTDTSGAAGFQSHLAEIRVGGNKAAITEGSAQAIVRFGIPASTNVFGATVFYTIYDINGANYTSRAGQVRVQGGNSSGTATCTINAGQDTEAEDGSQIATSNAATMTYTWTNVVSAANCDLSLNATSSQGTNTVAITWTAVVTGNSTSITVVGQ